MARRYRRPEIMITVDACVNFATNERHRRDLDCCGRMGRAGGGHVTEVRSYRHLPERLLGRICCLQ